MFNKHAKNKELKLYWHYLINNIISTDLLKVNSLDHLILWELKYQKF